MGFAFADDDLGKMRKRGKITGSADGALRGNYGMNAGVEHGAERFDNDGPHAAESLGKRIGPQQDHRASFGNRKRSADSTRVRAHQIDLQLADLFRGNTDGSKLAESGVDAVGGFVGGDKAIDDGARGLHTGDRGRSQRNGLVAQGNGVELVERE